MAEPSSKKRKNEDLSTHDAESLAEVSDCTHHRNCKARDVNCADADRILFHMTYSSTAILCSSTIPITVDSSGKHFDVHKDLLALHSNWYLNHLKTRPGGYSNSTLVQHQGLEGSCFAKFVLWLYSGDLKEVAIWETPGAKDSEDDLASLWAVGEVLECPAFQNLCMDRMRKRAREEVEWPGPSTVKAAYFKTSRRSLARKFIVDCCTFKKQFYHQDEDQLGRWRMFVEENPRFAVDVGRARKYNVCPAEEEFRSRYVVEEFDVEERWKQLIAIKALEY